MKLSVGEVAYLEGNSCDEDFDIFRILRARFVLVIREGRTQ